MSVRWVLAFDSSCATCRQVSRSVAQACAGRLEILPLADDEVQRWRETTGATALVPTLIRVSPTGGVRSWTGHAMALPLLRRLGLQASKRVISALGELRSADFSEQPHGSHQGPKMGRKQFLRFGAGIATAGLILRGQTPVFAADIQHVQEDEDAKSWADANADSLPHAYDAVTTLPPARQRVVWHLSSPEVKGKLWAEQFRRYSTQNPQLSTSHVKVLTMGIALANNQATFASDAHNNPVIVSKIKALETAARQTFGDNAAYTLFTKLGDPTSSKVAPASSIVHPDNVTCSCSTSSDWCSHNGFPSNYCRGSRCSCSQYKGCGTMMWYTCNGMCATDSC